MNNTIADLLFAIVITAIVVGPVIALLWLSWRAVVVGALSIGAVFLFFASVMSAGGTAWQPGSGNPYLIVAAGWTIAAIFAFAAYLLAGRGPGVKMVNIIIGYAALVWCLTMRHHVENAWWAVAHPEPPSTAKVSS
jgi:hypothetical protein